MGKTAGKRIWKSEKTKTKLRYLCRFLAVFLGSSLAISIIPLALAIIGILHSDHHSSQYIASVALLLYLAVSFVFCTLIGSKRRHARLYFKTSFAAYGLVILVSAALCLFLPTAAVWCFLPMRCVYMFGATNFVSYAVTHVLMLLIISAAYSAAVWWHNYQKRRKGNSSSRHKHHHHHHHHSSSSHSHHEHSS